MRLTIKAARINKGFTQNDFAKAIGVSKKTVHSWENGKTMPKLEKIELICSTLGVKYDDIKWRI